MTVTCQVMPHALIQLAASSVTVPMVLKEMEHIAIVCIFCVSVRVCVCVCVCVCMCVKLNDPFLLCYRCK